MDRAYRRRVYLVPAEAEDDVAAALHDAGALGCRVEDAEDGDRVMVEAWLDDPPPPGFDAFEAGLLDRPGVSLHASDTVEERDWLAEHRRLSRPFDLGEHFRVDPREPGETGETGQTAEEPERGRSGDDERILLCIPARTAFGTGSHESTRLCVRWLEELARDDGFGALRILDVGTGSGILALVAERLGAPPVTALDADAAAAIVARDNVLRNVRRNVRRNVLRNVRHDVRPDGCTLRLLAGTIESLRRAPVFDLALVNVLPERILPVYGEIVGRLRPGGRVLSSGNLVERRDELVARFAAFGLSPEGEKIEGEWISFLLTRSD